MCLSTITRANLTRKTQKVGARGDQLMPDHLNGAILHKYGGCGEGFWGEAQWRCHKDSSRYHAADTVYPRTGALVKLAIEELVGEGKWKLNECKFICPRSPRLMC